MSKASTRGARQRSRVPRRRAAQPWPHGSGSGIAAPPLKFFPKGQLLPVNLALRFNARLKGGLEAGREQLNRPAVLIHAQDPAFANCWFSRAIDLGDESGNPAFWMLEKTAIDTWFLCLRRVSGQMAAYHLTSRTKKFPIKLKKGRASKDFTWPATITIAQGG